MKKSLIDKLKELHGKSSPGSIIGKIVFGNEHDAELVSFLKEKAPKIIELLESAERIIFKLCDSKCKSFGCTKSHILEKDEWLGQFDEETK